MKGEFTMIDAMNAEENVDKPCMKVEGGKEKVMEKS